MKDLLSAAAHCRDLRPRFDLRKFRYKRYLKTSPRSPAIALPSAPEATLPAKPAKPAKRLEPRPIYRRYWRFRKVAIGYTVKRVPRAALASILLVSGAIEWERRHRAEREKHDEQQLAVQDPRTRQVCARKAAYIVASAAMLYLFAHSQ